MSTTLTNEVVDHKVKNVQTEHMQFSATRLCGGAIVVIRILVTDKRTCLLL